MTTFKEIRGTAIQSVSSDPTNPETGQIWYNNTIGVLKGYQLVAASWASGGNLNVSRSDLAVTGPADSSALAVGGYTGSGYSDSTEKYNGSTWTASGNYPISIVSTGLFGSQTAAVAAGGEPAAAGYRSALVNSFNGSTWTSATSLPGNRSHGGALGTETAGLVIGGSPTYSPYVDTNTTLEYSAGSWSSGGNLSEAKAKIMSSGSGTQTAGLIAGGSTGGTGGQGALATSESYDGTSWTSSPNINTARSQAGSFGTQASMVIAGGQENVPSPGTILATTEAWNGSSWSASTNLPSTIKGSTNGAGSSGNGLRAGGYDGTNYLNSTQEFTGAFLSAKKITTS